MHALHATCMGVESGGGGGTEGTRPGVPSSEKFRRGRPFSRFENKTAQIRCLFHRSTEDKMHRSTEIFGIMLIIDAVRLLFMFQMACNRKEPCNLLTFHYTDNDMIFDLKSFKKVPDEGSSSFDKLLETKWQDAMDKGLFRFSYDPKMPSKHFSGNFGFFSEVGRMDYSS